MARFRPTQGEPGQTRPISGKLGTTLARRRPKLVERSTECCARFRGKRRPASAKCSLAWATCSPSSAKFCPVRPTNSTKHISGSAQFGWLTGFGSNCATHWPMATRLGRFRQVRPRATEFGPISTNFGRCVPKPAHALHIEVVSRESLMVLRGLQVSAHLGRDEDRGPSGLACPVASAPPSAAPGLVLRQRGPGVLRLQRRGQHHGHRVVHGEEGQGRVVGARVLRAWGDSSRC